MLSMLEDHPGIVSVDLSTHEGRHRNRVGLKGASAVKSLLAQTLILTHLNLSNTCIGNGGLGLISEGLHSNTTVLSLDLSYNKISAIEHLCRALSVCSVKYLRLAGNSIGDRGCEALA